MRLRSKWLLGVVYVLATIQFVWSYLWLTRPYVNTQLYEQGRERMPFQGRLLMMMPMKWAHQNSTLHKLTEPFAKSHFWFPRPVAPEVLVQATADVFSILIAGFLTARMYQATSKRKLLTPMVFPLFLVVCGVTYIIHTVQNFRFIYDFESLAFFAMGMYLILLRKNFLYFIILFIVATVNRETTLLLLPLYMIDRSVEAGKLQWRLFWQRETMRLVLPLAAIWVCWQIFVRAHFAANPSELYPRLDWNVKSLIYPQSWPQLFSACGYLLLLIIVMRRRIANNQLRAWLWVLPIWITFMFVFGILIETRVFGELIPFVVCSTCLIIEETILIRHQQSDDLMVISDRRANRQFNNAA